MPGSDPSHANGGQDLLRRATQTMMSKPNEEDGHDHIDSDTPQSGVATPVPDLSDKRLPGITHSYIGQVGTGSSTNSTSVPLETPAIGSDFVNSPSKQREVTTDNVRSSEPSQSYVDSDSSSDDGDDDGPPLLPHERAEASQPFAHPALNRLHPYPTPPISTPPSLHKLKMSDSGSEGEGHEGHGRGRSVSPSHHDPMSESFPTKARRSSMLNPLSNILTSEDVHAAHFSNPSKPCPSNSPPPPSPAHSRVASGLNVDSPSYDRLRKLTDNAVQPREKSQPGTPTRALSNNNQTTKADMPPSKMEEEKIADADKDATAVEEGDEASGGSNGATVVAPRGKLTVKIIEARGLRKARDPYVVATFQRNELVSKGPRDEEIEKEDEAEALNPTGGIPILRTASESGRPMAIPMKSRQSSSSSNDYRDVRTHAVKALSNPRWDTEAAFDVVGAENRVNLSVYDRGSEREDFLGNVNFQPHLIENDPSAVKGWYELKGRNPKEAPAVTGEIYVEITYQRTDKRHFGPEDFDILKLIGKGTFGQVYQVRKKDTKRIYAMKVLQKKVIVQKKEVAHTVGERNILVRTAMADSPFIVGLKFSFQTPSDLYLVTDYMSGGELFWHLQKEGRFNEARAKFYIAELILALQHLHMHDIVYRDLKPENILLDANGHIALCDFGLSKANLTKNDTTNTFCGTTEYLAPEVLLDEAGYTKMVDFWSLGVLVFEMCCGWSPFYAEDTQQMYKNIAFGKVRFPRETLTTEGRNFVKGLLNRNPKHRLGATDDAEELKRHPFFADIDWDALTKKQIAPPFKPKLKSETDTSNFDPEFTNALNGASSLNARAAALAAGISSSTPLSPGMQANFKGFTFVDENLMEENLRHRVKDDYDNMDEDIKDDSHWEQAADTSRRDDRMSGVVNNGGFDM